MNNYRVKQKTYPVTGKLMWFTQKRFMLFFWRDVVINGSAIYVSKDEANRSLMFGVIFKERANKLYA